MGMAGEFQAFIRRGNPSGIFSAGGILATFNGYSEHTLAMRRGRSFRLRSVMATLFKRWSTFSSLPSRFLFV